MDLDIDEIEINPKYISSRDPFVFYNNPNYSNKG